MDGYSTWILFLFAIHIVPFASSYCYAPACNDQTEVNRAYTNMTHLNETSLNTTLPSDVCKLNVSGNYITEITNEPFSKGPYSYSLSNFYSLETLDLSNNLIQSIGEDTFESLRFLKFLDISGNRLTRLKRKWFSNFGCLEVLNASRNNIIHIENGVFTSTLSSLLDVNLAWNKLKSFEPWAYLPGSVKTFDLRYNEISKFTNDVKWVYNLKENYDTYVDMRYNHLTEWDDYFVKQYSSSPDSDYAADFITMFIDIRENNISCDCNIHYLVTRIQRSYYRYSDIEKFKVKCHSPPRMKNRDVFYDNGILDDLYCDLKNDCPVGCVCEGRPEANITYINCSNSNLQKMPDKLPKNNYKSIQMYFDNNAISILDDRDYIGEISILSLAGNSLSTIVGDAISKMDALEKLNVENNKLKRLPKSIQFQLPYEHININKNPISCDCTMTWMKDWVTLSPWDTPGRDIKCRHDDSSSDYKLTDVTEDLLSCSYDMAIALAVAFGIFFIVCIIAAVWAKKCPYETKVLLYRFLTIHPRDKYKVDREEDIHGDLYVSFDDNDIHIRQWVLKQMTKQLEEQKPRYNVFIPYRDLMGRAGEDKSEVILEQMEKSKRIAIILSEGYDRNEWCTYECQRAELIDFNPGRVIFVEYNPEVSQMINQEPWNSRVQGRKILKRGETRSEKRWFWYKLKYELPVK